MIKSAASNKPTEFKEAFKAYVNEKKKTELDYYRFREGQRFLKGK